MLVRTIAISAALAFLGNSLPAQEDIASVSVGDFLDIEMTGDLAKEYARRCSDTVTASLDGLHISTTAIVMHKLRDGRIRIEHFSTIDRNGNVPLLVTLTATVDSKSVTANRTPKGSPIYASPIDRQNGSKPVGSKGDTRMFRLKLSELKDLKLRTWTLVEEIGD